MFGQSRKGWKPQRKYGNIGHKRGETQKCCAEEKKKNCYPYKDPGGAEQRSGCYECAALEDSLKMKLKEKEENHERHLKEKEESVKKKMAEQQERELEKIQQRFAEDLQAKQEATRKELLLIEEDFMKEQNERQKHEEDLIKKEEWLKQELWNKERSFNKQLTDMFQQCMQRAEEMGLQHKELEQKLQESMQMRQQEERRKEEIQSLSAQISDLQVRRFNFYSAFRKLSLIFSAIENTRPVFLQLQMQKKLNKCFFHEAVGQAQINHPPRPPKTIVFPSHVSDPYIVTFCLHQSSYWRIPQRSGVP